MPALKDLPEIFGFFSYSRDDDRDSDGSLSWLRRRIQSELRAQMGRSEKTLTLWQDAEAIEPGVLWEANINGAIEQSSFFIPIVTPRVINSKYCRIEFERFLARERGLGRSDLIFPVIYIEVPELNSEAEWRDHPVLNIIGARQYVDWSEFRFDLKSPEVGRAIAQFCRTIRGALGRAPSATALPAIEPGAVIPEKADELAEQRHANPQPQPLARTQNPKPSPPPPPVDLKPPVEQPAAALPPPKPIAPNKPPVSGAEWFMISLMAIVEAGRGYFFVSFYSRANASFDASALLPIFMFVLTIYVVYMILTARSGFAAKQIAGAGVIVALYALWTIYSVISYLAKYGFTSWTLSLSIALDLVNLAVGCLLIRWSIATLKTVRAREAPVGYPQPLKNA